MNLGGEEAPLQRWRRARAGSQAGAGGSARSSSTRRAMASRGAAAASLGGRRRRNIAKRTRGIASSLALRAMTKWCLAGNKPWSLHSENQTHEQRVIHAAGRRPLRAALPLRAQPGPARGGRVRSGAADLLYLGDEG